MTVHSSAGARLGVCAAAPATFDKTGYAALEFIEIGEVTDLGEFGRTYNVIKHNPLKTRATVKKKGSYDEGTVSIVVGIDNADAGQELLNTALLSDSDYYFEITMANGDIYYFPAQVTKFTTAIGKIDTITTGNLSLEITSAGAAGVGVVLAAAA